MATFGDIGDPVWKIGMSNPGEGVSGVSGVSGASGYSISHWPITHVDEDDYGNRQYGQFELQWIPAGQREGDYFICWSWTPVQYVSLSAHCVFSLAGNTKITTTIPTHNTQPGKYETLLERYLPELFKNFLSANDVTPQVLQQFHQAIADGFTVLENLNNQLLDVINSNVVQEAFLPWLGNLFGLILRSQDPTLWRRQIKRAIPLYKKKGTLSGLSEALAQANIFLTGYYQLWQFISPYTWQESFIANSVTPTFTLSETLFHASSPASYLNFELYHRVANSNTWITLADANRTKGTLTINNFFNPISTTNGVTTIIWSSAPINIGDEIRIIYQIADVGAHQTLETYMRSLSLADQRFVNYGTYPPQNWNVRLIEDDDANFSNIIQIRNPWNEFLVFGQVRTEFAYSENIYNMEEYNGSLRDSTNPCHINKDFIDPCSGGLSSFYNIDLQFDQLTDARITEAKEIIQEYTPFHSSVFSLGTNGVINDFVPSPIEEIDIIINYLGMETMISNGQLIFNRVMNEGSILAQTANNSIWASALRSDLAVPINRATDTGLIQNQAITIFCRDSSFSGLPLYAGDTTILEILSGVYGGMDLSLNLTNPATSLMGNVAMIQGLSDVSGLNTTPFSFRLSKDIYSYSNASISFYQTNQAIVDLTGDTSLGQMRNLFKMGNYVLYNGVQYPIIQFLSGNRLIIDNYSLGGAAGVNIHVYSRLLDNQTGNFNYYGTTLTTNTNYETSLPILNGANGADPSLVPVADNSSFQENYLIQINGNLFEIVEINGTQITLTGPQLAWSLAGATVSFNMLQYVKTPVSIPQKYIHPWPGHNFNYVDRGGGGSGNDIIESSVDYSTAYVYLENLSLDELIALGLQDLAELQFMGTADLQMLLTKVYRMMKTEKDITRLDNTGFTNSFAPIMDATNKNQAVDITGVQESITFKIQWAEEV